MGSHDLKGSGDRSARARPGAVGRDLRRGHPHEVWAW
jgi:hypothetical protein